MLATAAAGQEFLKQAWGEEKLNQVNAMLEARDKTDDEAKASGDSAAPPEEAPTSSSSSETSPAPPKAPAKPKLSKARTMKATADEGKSLLGKDVLGDTRSETKRRQAAVNATKALELVTKASGKRKATLKRLGTMANTAKEGRDFVKRTSAKSAKTTTGRSRTGGRKKKGN